MSLDLSGCAAEPIRVVGSIQPHGWLIGIDRHSDDVVAYSGNCSELTGLSPGGAQSAALRALIAPLVPIVAVGQKPLKIGTLFVAGRMLDVASHAVDSLVLLELEPARSPRMAPDAIGPFSHGFMEAAARASSIQPLVALAASEMRRITGFGRCVIYSFDAEGHGCVLAEDSAAGYDSYLGHSFPASDIPSQARELYRVNHIRVIPDASCTPSLLHYAYPSWNALELDLSFAHLRSVSPVHLEFMRNMRTSASMSVSIIVRDKLWGLISCHNTEPHGLDLDSRHASELLGQFLSLVIGAREESAALAVRLEQRGLTMEILSHLGESDASLRELLRESGLLLQLTGAGGAAVVYGDHCWTTGATPSREEVLGLAAWAETRSDIQHTDHLAGTDAPPLSVEANAAGMLAVRLSDAPRHMILWFRPEVTRSVRWAGEPLKQHDDGGRLHPRLSFESWEEIVRSHSAPWTAGEIAGAGELRSALLQIVLQRVRERAQAAELIGRLTEAKETAEQGDSAKTRFLAVLSHELRTPLTSIVAAAEVLSRFPDAPERYAGLVKLIQRSVAVEFRLVDDLLDMSAVSNGKLHLVFEHVDMHDMVTEVVRLLASDVDDKGLRLSVIPAAQKRTVRADPVRIQQVLWNLLRNAVKFTPRYGSIEVRSTHSAEEFVLTCEDTGIGIDAATIEKIFNAFEQGDTDLRQRQGGLGLGLTIASGIVQGHGGTLTATSDGAGRGAMFTLRLPLEAA